MQNMLDNSWVAMDACGRMAVIEEHFHKETELDILKQRIQTEDGLAWHVWLAYLSDELLRLSDVERLVGVAFRDFPWLTRDLIDIAPTENLMYPNQVGIHFIVYVGSTIPDEYKKSY